MTTTADNYSRDRCVDDNDNAGDGSVVDPVVDGSFSDDASALSSLQNARAMFSCNDDQYSNETMDLNNDMYEVGSNGESELAGQLDDPTDELDGGRTLQDSTVDTFTIRKQVGRTELSCQELWQMLCEAEGSLQALEVMVSILQLDRTKSLIRQVRYGRSYSNGVSSDPLWALQRDAEICCDYDALDERQMDQVYAKYETLLCDLNESNQNAQEKMQKQLINMERRYQKVVRELDENRRQHAEDAAKGDDATMNLTKERERLRQEIEFEKQVARKQEKELKKLKGTLEQEQVLRNRYKQASLQVIHQQKEISQCLESERAKVEQLEKTIESLERKYSAAVQQKTALQKTHKDPSVNAAAGEISASSPSSSETTTDTGVILEKSSSTSSTDIDQLHKTDQKVDQITQLEAQLTEIEMEKNELTLRLTEAVHNGRLLEKQVEQLTGQLASLQQQQQQPPATTVVQMRPTGLMGTASSTAAAAGGRRTPIGVQPLSAPVLFRSQSASSSSTNSSGSSSPSPASTTISPPQSMRRPAPVIRANVVSNPRGLVVVGAANPLTTSPRIGPHPIGRPAAVSASPSSNASGFVRQVSPASAPPRLNYQALQQPGPATVSVGSPENLRPVGSAVNGPTGFVMGRSSHYDVSYDESTVLHVMGLSPTNSPPEQSRPMGRQQSDTSSSGMPHPYKGSVSSAIVARSRPTLTGSPNSTSSPPLAVASAVAVAAAAASPAVGGAVPVGPVHPSPVSAGSPAGPVGSGATRLYSSSTPIIRAGAPRPATGAGASTAGSRVVPPAPPPRDMSVSHRSSAVVANRDSSVVGSSAPLMAARIPQFGVGPPSNGTGVPHVNVGYLRGPNPSMNAGSNMAGGIRMKMSTSPAVGTNIIGKGVRQPPIVSPGAVLDHSRKTTQV